MPEPCIRRVLMTGDTVGGVWNYVLELSAALSSRGVEVVLACMGGVATDAQREEAAQIRGLRLFTTGHKLEWMENPWADVAESGQLLLELEKQHEPDLIHLNTYGHGSLLWQHPMVLTAHSCVLSWWAAVKGEPAPAEWRRYRQTVKEAVCAADVLVAPSHAMLRAVETHYGPDLPDCRMVIHNGRTPHRFSAHTKEPFVLTAGRLWDEAKNAAAVARIAPRLPWPVYLAGNNCEPGGSATPFDACVMLGRISSKRLADWYARASIYALPARYEPFGLSALEAALSGCALVLGDIASLREIWQDAAVYVAPENDAALECVLRDLIENPERRESLANRARERARMFGTDKMVQEYLDAYRVAAGARRVACAL